jgi:hypothetical protein
MLDAPSEELAEIAGRMEAIEGTLRPPVFVHALVDGTGEDERVHIRGNHQNVGNVVPRRMPVSLCGEHQEVIERGSGRLEMARRMVDSSNSLVARVIINRLWHYVFGVGIVPTVDDFGAMGQPPSHPKLLDWMAADFMQHGWSIKRALRQMVMSATYRMSSRSSIASDTIASVDPANRLLHKARVRRLTAEAIRDSVLAVSGRLDRQTFGPSVPVHINEFMEGRGQPASGPLDGQGRRSIYIKVRRNFLSPMMLAFDMPSPFSTMGRRSVSNVPSQSLIMMNDPFVIQQARVWAEQLVGQQSRASASGSSEGTLDDWSTGKIVDAFETGIGRLPTDGQVAALHKFIRQQAAAYSTGETDVRVWTDLCHAIMNMKEFIYIH